MTVEAPVATGFRDVEIALIDEPDNAMRASFDPTAMEDLVDSMRTHGLLQPIGIVIRGGRFEIGWGHRRSIAAFRLGWERITARVFPEGTSLEAAKNAENSDREDVNPADEAEYFQRLLASDECGGDVMRLVTLVRRKESYVQDRLDLLRGYKEVFAALKNAQINQSVAKELNRYKDHAFMLTHLSAAIDGGAKASQVRRWRTDLERMGNFYNDTPVADGDTPAGPVALPPPMECIVCNGSKDPSNLEFIYIHRSGPCADLLLNFIARMR